LPTPSKRPSLGGGAGSAMLEASPKRSRSDLSTQAPAAVAPDSGHEPQQLPPPPQQQPLQQPQHTAAAALQATAAALQAAGPEVPAAVPPEELSIRLKGVRMEIRARKPPAGAKAEEVAGTTDASIDIHDSDSDAETVGGPSKALKVALLQKPQLLRISAGRAAAAAGIHPYADIGEIFLELLYQDQPELLMRDAAIAGIEVVSPVVERARLLAKSGEVASVEATMNASKQAMSVEGARAAQEALRVLVKVAEQAGRLTAEEAQELKSTLESEINLEFGARHEDAALEAYSARTRRKVYGEQRRVDIPLPKEGPEQALFTVFPTPRTVTLSWLDAESAAVAEAVGADAAAGASCAKKQEEKPYFRLTGFIDGLIDLPRATAKGARGNEQGEQTVVIEVKHRMGKIKDPPMIYDIVQLGSYCRALGCTRGELVQCLREHGTDTNVGTLHVTAVDFSEGSMDRTGWDRHVLPGLYSMATAVYQVREDAEFRQKLLLADPAARTELVRTVCAHLK